MSVLFLGATAIAMQSAPMKTLVLLSVENKLIQIAILNWFKKWGYNSQILNSKAVLTSRQGDVHKLKTKLEKKFGLEIEVARINKKGVIKKATSFEIIEQAMLEQ